MPRDLPIGNGRLLINFDRAYQLRDLYYPHVGKENHTSGHAFRLGFWAEGQLRWIDDPGWERSLLFDPETGATDVQLHHADLGLRIRATDVVDYEVDLYLKRLVIANERADERQIRLFFHHDFHISETEVGDTAYYEPERRSLFHYKGERWFQINACPAPWIPPAEAEKSARPSVNELLRNGTAPAPVATTSPIPSAETFGFQQWATGAKEAWGAEGTWRDAEDGELGGNPIAQGAVDSTGALYLTVPASGEAGCYYWIAAGKDFGAVTRINRLVRERGPQSFFDRTNSYWRLWVNKEDVDYEGLPPKLVELYKRSQLIARTQIDDGGAILAANDWDITRTSRDTYSYVWPRDGALVAHALDLAGHSTPSQRFFEFCARTVTREGYFLHKYNPDGSLGSSWQPWMGDGHKQLPIQEDETGLVIWALWQHFKRFRDVEFIEELYDVLIVPAAQFLISYRHVNDGLPLPSYDLWEERRGILAYTVGAVYGGLAGAAGFAGALGDRPFQAKILATLAELRRGADQLLWRPEANRFVRMLRPQLDGTMIVDWTVDASVYGLWAFGMYAPDDPRIVATMENVRETLWVQSAVGGVARYQNDYYQKISDDVEHVPGNPWFICTMWLAQWYIAKAKRPDELQAAIDLLMWVAERALPSGVLAEQVHPYTGEPLSVSPLTWSHAGYITAFLELLNRQNEMALCPTCGTPGFRGTRMPLDGHQHAAAPVARSAEG